MRFLLFKNLQPEKGIPYSDRQLKWLEAKGLFPKRVALCAGGSLKGWPEILIDQHIEALVEMSKSAQSDRP
jgi:hypothetical protein